MDEDENDLGKLLAYQTKLFDKLKATLTQDEFKLVLELAAVSETIGEF